jgi:superfamily II DNA or RNA helicase
MELGIYEALVTQLVQQKINSLSDDQYFIHTHAIDKAEAAQIIAQHLSQLIKKGFDSIKSEHALQKQIEIANKIIFLLKDEILNEDFESEIIKAEGQILKAILSKLDAHFTDFPLYIKEITPYTRLTHSELFTGGNAGLSLESELKKEIRSSNRIDFLVSFIKFKGIIILYKDLEEFTKRGGKLRIISTTYMGATDYKAIQLLSQLENTEIKISYNNGNERLHAKAYLFYRKTGFHTGYIGSSNFSRSALTDGLEWNLKITTKEVSHIIDKFQKTFDSYWQSNDFERYDDNIHSPKLKEQLKEGKIGKFNIHHSAYFDIKPHPYQLEILEKLEVERSVHQRNRNLIVAATGTGKTVVSAFDYKDFIKIHPHAKLLFLAHRKEILTQALSTFQNILRDNNFGELWVDGYEPTNYEYVFASVQTLNNRIPKLGLSPTYYDFIVIDECHHLTASSYRKIIQYFQPKVLLGLTATPERMDGGDIQEDFHNRIAAEIRLPEALNRKLLCPFQYFGITDSIDLTSVSWDKGKYKVSELTNLYTTNDRRVNEVINALHKYTKDEMDTRTLGFCASIAHAEYMANKFNLANFKAASLTSSNEQERDILRKKLTQKEINYLFVVDIFNEGIDIPEIDTVLFLRPTESLTIFLQQLGRGLRLAEGKESLTVLDFVGNARPEYNFENKFRALVGKTNQTILKEIEDNFPHLPLGCSIVLEKKAKEIILKNIKAATAFNRLKLIQKIRNFQHQTTLPLTLTNFLYIYQIPIQYIYKNKQEGWSRLCQKAGIIDDFENTNEKEIFSAISNKWLSTSSNSYFQFILSIAKKNFQISISDFNEVEKSMLLMLHYDVWQEPGGFTSLEESIRTLGKNVIMVNEIIEVLELLQDKVGFKEIEINLPYKQPLKVHSRYTRDQILVAFDKSTFESKYASREGVAENKALKTEFLFINLVKSEENFSPTTMYDDYAVSEVLFHWQSQNSAGPETPKGRSYINHLKEGKRILLFVREKSHDEFGKTMGYVFIGEATLQDYEGAKPMNIKWELHEPLPHFLWNEAAKLRVG